MKENILKNKSYQLGLNTISLCKNLKRHNEFVISKQLLRAGTAVGALIREAEFGQSKLDFVSKMSIALKEANETDYWLSILKDSQYLQEKEYQLINKLCLEIIKLLIATIKTAKTKTQ